MFVIIACLCICVRLDVVCLSRRGTRREREIDRQRPACRGRRRGALLRLAPVMALSLPSCSLPFRIGQVTIFGEPPHNEILGQPVQAGVYLSLGTQISL